MVRELIHKYTRADALEEGVLVDISSIAKEAGIKYPVAITQAVNEIIKDKPDIEDINGRLWDVVWMLRCAISGAIPSRKVNDSTICYEVILNKSNTDFENFNIEKTTLKAVMHAGDDWQPVITIMLPSEGW